MTVNDIPAKSFEMSEALRVTGTGAGAVLKGSEDVPKGSNGAGVVFFPYEKLLCGVVSLFMVSRRDTVTADLVGVVC